MKKPTNIGKTATPNRSSRVHRIFLLVAFFLLVVLFVALTTLFLYPLFVSASSHEETNGFDADDPASWDFSDPLLYDHPEVFENPAMYSTIQWELVPESSYAHVVDWGAIHDFSSIILSSQHIVWSNVHQEHITGRKVAEIPTEHFDPTQVRKENLQFATADQIGLHLTAFDNLRDANPTEVSKVFAQEPFHAELDITRANTVRFDPETQMITGDFPSYDPADYPKGSYQQQIIGQQVIITPLKEDGTADAPQEVIIFGRQATFFRNPDNSVSVDVTGTEEAGITGKQNSHITTNDGTELDADTREDGEVVIEENGDIHGKNTRVRNTAEQHVIDGTFSIKEHGLRIELQSDGGQSRFFDEQTQTMVATNGNSGESPLVAVREEYGVPADADSYVVYGNDVLRVHGLAQAEQYDLKAITEHPDAAFAYDHEAIDAQGLVRFDDEISSYQGYGISSSITRHREDDKHVVHVQGGEDGLVGVYVQKAAIVGLPESQPKSNEIIMRIDRQNGELSVDIVPSSISLLADTAQTPGRMIIFDNQLLLRTGEEAIEITKAGGMLYTDSKGEQLEILSPQNTQFVVGNKLLRIHKELDGLTKRIEEATASGNDASLLISQRDLLQFLNAHYQMRGMLDVRDYDGAINQLTTFMDEHGDSPALSYAKMSLAEVYLAKASTAADLHAPEAQQDYQQAAALYRDVLAQPDLSDDARRGIAVTLHQQKLYDQARDAYFSIADSAPDDPSTAQVYLAIAGTYLESNDNPRFAIVALDQALQADPQNQEAIELKIKLESALLDTISNAISSDDAVLMKQWEEKIGLDQKVWNVGIGTSMMALFTDYYEHVETSAQLVKGQLDVQQRGILLIKSLHDQGYSFNEIKGMSGEEIAGIFHLPVGSDDEQRRTAAMQAAAEMTVSIREALRNQDVQRLTDGRIMENFAFETGEGYVDKKFLEKNWKDKVANAVDVKNTIIFLLPAAKLGVIGTSSGAAAAGLTAETTVVGTVISGGKAVAGLVGSERAAQLVGLASGMIQTIASSKVMQILGRELTTGIGVIDKSLSLVSRLIIEEGAETGAGYTVQAVVSTFAPGSAETVGLITEIVAGQSNIIDAASEGIEQGGKAIARGTARKMLLNNEGKVLGEVTATFTTPTARDEYVTSIEKLAKIQGEPFANKGYGVFTLQGRTYVATIEGTSIPDIDGTPAAAIATVNPKAMLAAVDKQADKARDAIREAEQAVKRTRDLPSDTTDTTSKLAIQKTEVQEEGISACPVLVAAAVGVCTIEPPTPTITLQQRLDEPELVETGHPDLRQQNAPSPTHQQIGEGKDLLAKIEAFKNAERRSDEFNQLADDLYWRATRDQYGAMKSPEFEKTIRVLQRQGQKYYLVEVSMPRETLKQLNDQGYDVGSRAIRQQHTSLVQAANDLDAVPMTLQKTTFIACKTQECVDSIMQKIRQVEQELQQTVPNGQDMMLQVGIAPGRDELMHTRLHTRRSMRYNQQQQGDPVPYNDEVKNWYNALPLEEQANANDIFHGFDRIVAKEYATLSGLKKHVDEGTGGGTDEWYQQKLIQLVQNDVHDASFSTTQIVKAYQTDPITGIHDGDIVVAIDGIGVGKKNKDDIIRLTQNEEGHEEMILALLAGNRVDKNIINVNKKIKELHDAAVDNIRIQPAEVIQKYRIIAKAAGYDGSIDSLDDLKTFLKWEFERRGRFRGGDEAFMTFRREVLDANPTLAEDLPNNIRNCGKPCGYDIRVGVKEVAAGETYTDALEKADSAVLLSKKHGDVPVVIAKDGTITGVSPKSVPDPELERFKQLARLKSPEYAAREAEKYEKLAAALEARGEIEQVRHIEQRLDILRQRAQGGDVSLEDITSSDIGKSAITYLRSRGIPDDEAARLIAQVDISAKISKALELSDATSPRIKEVVLGDEEKMGILTNHLHRYVSKNFQAGRAIQALDTETTSLSYFLQGKKGEVDSVVTISLDEKGRFSIEHYLLEPPTPDTLEATIQQANKKLREIEEIEEKLTNLYKEQELPQEQRQSGISDHDLEEEIQKMIGEHRTQVGSSSSAEGYRKITAGTDAELSSAILIQEDHLEQLQNAVDLVKQDIARVNPDHIIYSGRGGYPYRPLSDTFPAIETSDIFSSSSAVGADQTYSGLIHRLNELIQEKQGEQAITVALIEGGEFSGGSARNIRNSIKKFQRADNKKAKLEVIIYTFRQNQDPDHFNNMGRLTSSSADEEVATTFTIPEQNVEVIHKRVDVPLVIGEDKGMMVGQLPDETIIRSHAPLVIFNEDGIVNIVDPGLESTTAETFASMLN